MTNDIRCSFEGHACRKAICQGEAASFFRTAKGTVWPLCEACGQRHKTVGMAMVQTGRVEASMVVEAKFDIPLEDEGTRKAFEDQDPGRISHVIGIVDMVYQAE